MQCKRRTVLGMLGAFFGAVASKFTPIKAAADDNSCVQIQFARDEYVKVMGPSASIRAIYESWKKEIQADGPMHKYADGHRIDETVLSSICRSWSAVSFWIGSDTPPPERVQPHLGYEINSLFNKFDDTSNAESISENRSYFDNALEKSGVKFVLWGHASAMRSGVVMCSKSGFFRNPEDLHSCVAWSNVQEETRHFYEARAKLWEQLKQSQELKS